jgi:hypothetical protein
VTPRVTNLGNKETASAYDARASRQSGPSEAQTPLLRAATKRTDTGAVSFAMASR